MAKVKIDDGRYAELQDFVRKAITALDEAMKIWGTNFDNLYNNFVANGFLDKLYKDAESNYHTWSRGLSAVSNVVSGAALGCAIGGWVGAIVGAVIGTIFGVWQFCKGDPEWITVSKEVLEQMLANCRAGADDAYIYMANMYAKLENSIIALERVRTRINDFNFYGADFSESAGAYDLKLRTSDVDGLTIMGVETEVVIDGKTVTMDTSEAMSAFYTYAYTVTSSVIAADYLERTYGYDIDFLGLVANANAFMADTIQSDLYTSEMIELILPAYSPDEQAAYAAASAATGLDQSELQAALGDVAALGVGPLFAGLVGAGFMGKIKEEPKSDPTTEPDTEPKTEPKTEPDTDPGSGPGSGPGSNPGSDPGTNPGSDPSTEPASDPRIDPIVEPDVPFDKDIPIDLGVVDEKGNVDYDQLAYEDYQFEVGAEAIEEYRLGIMEEVEAQYTSGNFSALTEKLKEFGYATPQIATILASKSMTITAILDGNTRSILSAKAVELAKADGVDGYDSKYTNNPTMTQLADDKKPLKSLHVNSDNKELVDMEKNLDTLEDSYKTKVEEANSLLDSAANERKTVDGLKEKFEKEYGTDTTKWSDEAVKEYDSAVDKYNASADAANKAIAEADAAKTSYQKSRDEFEKACDDYYMSKVVQDSESSSGQNYETAPTNPDVPNVSGNATNITDQSGFEINPDGTVSFGSSNVSSSNSNSSSTSSTIPNTGSGSYMSQEDFLAALGLKSDKDNN